jgi:hypothetical protein
VKTRTCWVIVLVFSLAAAASAQRIPDFSGRWIAVGPGFEGFALQITQTRDTLKLTKASGPNKGSVTYNLNGTARREPARPSEEHWSSAAWRNGTLMLTETRLTRTSEIRVEHTLSFDSTGRLILGLTSMQLDAGRDPSAPLPAPRSKTVIVFKKRR